MKRMTKSSLILFVGILLLIGLLGSCDTRREILEEEGVWVRVEMDWSQSQLTSRNGASIWFFPRNGSKPIVKLTHEEIDSVKLSRGDYSLIVFNETIYDHNYIAFRGVDKYETFEAYAKPITPSNRYNKSSQSASSPDLLAIARVDRFSVTREATRGLRPLIHVMPKQVINLVTVIVHVKGLDNVAASGSALSLGGLSDGVNLSTGRATTIPVTHLATLNAKTFNAGSFTEGTMTAQFNSFGLIKALDGTNSGQNIVTLYFRLRGKLPNGSYDLQPMEINVTDIIYQSESEYKVVVEIKDKVVIPYVPDENNPGSGFDADVEDWGPPIITEIPL